VDVVVVDEVEVVGTVVVGATVVVVVAGGTVVLVVVGGATVEVVVEGAGQLPLEPHASQQLDVAPTQALPPFGAVHAAPSRLMLHLVFPFLSLRQQVTKPSLPHVERHAQRMI
jgi:hypothetical protein